MISPIPIKLCGNGQLLSGQSFEIVGDMPSSSRVHDSLPIPLSKSSIELVPVM